MHVLKITAQGLTTSFRYPHFMMSVQPTYEMPPPATLYGHIASALGRWFDPAEAQFALHFTYERKIEDVETTILLKRATGKMPNNKALPKVLEGNANPFRREILTFPRLTLYVNRPDWLDAFRRPRYAVALGRSQDLFTYTQIQTVELEARQKAYLEHTLLPYDFARHTAAGRVVLMPRWLGHERRQPRFQRYVVLNRRVHTNQFYRFQGEAQAEFWTDPTAPKFEGDPLGLVFLSWTDRVRPSA
ncbi:MAG: CRISPR-associated protein Cas5 [Caldilineae bacterium]|nr:MAG: CRISPR-associated protein Cas5 [Caldilineae bacterium]